MARAPWGSRTSKNTPRPGRLHTDPTGPAVALSRPYPMENNRMDMPSDFLKNTLAIYDEGIMELLAAHAPEPFRDAIGYCFDAEILERPDAQSGLPAVILPDGTFDLSQMQAEWAQPEPDA